jgi:hypothetical protein
VRVWVPRISGIHQNEKNNLLILYGAVLYLQHGAHTHSVQHKWQGSSGGQGITHHTLSLSRSPSATTTPSSRLRSSSLLPRHAPSGVMFHFLVPQRRLFLVSTSYRTVLYCAVLYLYCTRDTRRRGGWCVPFWSAGGVLLRLFMVQYTASPTLLSYLIISYLVLIYLPGPGRKYPLLFLSLPMSLIPAAEADANERTGERTRRSFVGPCHPTTYVCVSPGRPPKAAGWMAWNARVSRS